MLMRGQKRFPWQHVMPFTWGRNQQMKKKLSMQWQFHGREARVSIGSYFKELELILEKHDLKDKHYLIYNIDVKGIY